MEADAHGVGPFDGVIGGNGVLVKTGGGGGLASGMDQRKRRRIVVRAKCSRFIGRAAPKDDVVIFGGAPRRY